jgi:hypothetical protein
MRDTWSTATSVYRGAEYRKVRMKILTRIAQVFRASRANEEESAEYVPYSTYDWREPLLIEAARKHGKAFKCAGDELPREIMLRGKELVEVGVGAHTMHGSAQLTVPQRQGAESTFARLSDFAVVSLHGKSEIEPSNSL